MKPGEFIPGPYDNGHCVKEYNDGNVLIRICDDYCSYPDQKERNERILERCGEIYMDFLRRQAREEAEKEAH